MLLGSRIKRLKMSVDGVRTYRYIRGERGAEMTGATEMWHSVGVGCGWCDARGNSAGLEEQITLSALRCCSRFLCFKQ